MSPIAAALLCFAFYFAAYRLYAHYLSIRVFGLDPARPTPAHRYRDDIDYASLLDSGEA